MRKTASDDAPRWIRRDYGRASALDEGRVTARVASVEIIVYGTPVPQGSKRAFFKPGMKHAVIIEDNKRTKPWRQEIAGAAVEAMRGRAPVVGCACQVDMLFCFDRPKSLAKRILQKMTKPDIDKLTRTVLDALTGTVFKDDAQVVRIRAAKVFDERPRAEIKITVLTDGVKSRAGR